MSFKLLLLRSITFLIHFTFIDASMECTVYETGKDIATGNSYEIIVSHCPSLPGSDETFCCYNEDRHHYCCTEVEFYFNSFFCHSKNTEYLLFSFSIIIIIVLIVGISIGCLCPILIKPLSHYQRPIWTLRRR